MPGVVLLDVDGTLVDSNDLHAMAWVDALKDQGFAVSCDAVRPLIGMGGDKLLPHLTGLEPESERGKRLSACRAEIFRERYMPRVNAFPSARPLLEALRDRGLDLYVATSAQEAELDELLQRGGIADLLPNRTSADDVSKSKPDPDILQAALHKAKCSPAEAWMLGDTPYDAEAARRSGVSFVGLLCGGHAAEEFAYAAALYRDPKELLERLPDSPFALRR
jgi:HAD superfamily hydrolase (TIGR01509 family)